MQYIVNEYFKYFFHYKEDTDLLESIIDAEDKVTYYTYNAWHEKTSETSPRWEESGAEDFTTY
ncbi:MAG: hypothetical protein HUU50_23280, partial [Candidatus Brocadiae bacterium]|nr:hypothetical protein [Candidatus Brocadiia bacterium]